jgi:hypothetical protein
MAIATMRNKEAKVTLADRELKRLHRNDSEDTNPSPKSKFWIWIVIVIAILIVARVVWPPR